MSIFRFDGHLQNNSRLLDPGSGARPVHGYDDRCRVRMQRVGALLLVQDNGLYGGYGVTLTGLYRRKK